jgi:mono/diheme cytochrome c family protein
MSHHHKINTKIRLSMKHGMLALIFLGVYQGLASCDTAEKSQFNNRKGATIGSASLDGKRFDDAEFKCLTLGEDEADLELTQTKQVTYKADIEPLFVKKCVSCHPSVSPPDLKTYDAVKKTATANYDTMVDGSMPPGKPMPQEEIQLFKAWMDGGMVEGAAAASSPAPAPAKGKSKNKSAPTPRVSPACAAPSGLEQETPAPAANPSPSPASGGPIKAVYLGGVEPFLKVKCVNCHGPGATPPDLSTYALAKQEGASSKATIDDGSMPPPATKVTMTKEEKAAFSEWVAKGYPEK